MDPVQQEGLHGILVDPRAFVNSNFGSGHLRPGPHGPAFILTIPGTIIYLEREGSGKAESVYR
jgi:hypothetical protein